MFPHENDFDGFISTAAQDQRLPFGIIKGVIAQESNFVANAYRAEPSVNDASYGLMQLLSSTARGMGFGDPVARLFDPQTNINLGSLFLRQLYDTASNSGYPIDSAISAYNAGFSLDRPGDGKRDTDRVDGYTDDGSQLAPFINQPYVDNVLRYAQIYAQPNAQKLATVNVTASSLGSSLPLLLIGALVLGVVASRR
jgi:soluble lytic murein transglycosylase-like protein